MTVTELIKELSEHDGDKEVYLSPVISRCAVTSVDGEIKRDQYDQDWDEFIVVLS